MAKIVPLKELCLTEITDGTHQTPTYVDNGVVFLSSKNVTEEKIDWENTMQISQDLHNTLYKRIAPRKDDILLAKNGTTGVAAIVDRDCIFDIYVSLALIRPNKDIVLPKYLLYAINNETTKAFFSSHLKGIGVPNLHLTHIRETPIKLYALDEQREIVHQLDKVSELISLRKKQLQKLDDLVKSRFVEMFGDVEKNSKHWNTVQLSQLCDLQNGYAFKSDDYLPKSNVINCRMSNIRPDGGFDAEYNPKYLPDEYWMKYQAYQLHDGDVIIAMTDMASDPKILGVPTIVKTKGKRFLLNQRVGKLIFLDDGRVNRVYLMYYLGQAFIRKNLAKLAGGSTQINVGKPEILSIKVQEPPAELQELFSNEYERISSFKQTVKQGLDKLEQMKQALMQKYFG